MPGHVTGVDGIGGGHSCVPMRHAVTKHVHAACSVCTFECDADLEQQNRIPRPSLYACMCVILSMCRRISALRAGGTATW